MSKGVSVPSGPRNPTYKRHAQQLSGKLNVISAGPGFSQHPHSSAPHQPFPERNSSPDCNPR